ncbi:DUF4832 domain-containing protein [bacterium]|nr:DUF4832 domain-containing protein [bacterium]MDA7537539.1 hypothetical protein [Akkermansiaceae bacterium]MDA7629413.1 hypothetical protein [Akkermansiaceae bacterium]MDA8968467.1 hypothetical protein [Akkermansiaceae bacterium]MDB4271309.1 hypothetical protein [Akkermansiaceae bacterium]
MKFLLLFLLCLQSLTAKELRYSPAPADNPLKGLVPYASQWKKDRFPHSMEFGYLSMAKLMTGWDQFDWSELETKLEKSKAGGKQVIFRVYLEYPGKDVSISDFLIKEGVKITEWKDGNQQNKTPDYADPRLRKAMTQFITALGKKYDGDPRIGFITAGILGMWGEWHNYPRTDLFASREVQKEVMDAFDASFNKTHILLRYPAGKDHYQYVDNRDAGFGYHDDSFAWATVGSGKKEEDWFFLPSLKSAGMTDKWKQFPIGGETRPEIWKTIFTDKKIAQEEDFLKCVEATHVSWLMDSSVFLNDIPLSEERKARAIDAVQKMGYELFIKEARLDGSTLVLQIENRGVAPFYHDWPVELRYSAPNIRTKPLFPEVKLSTILPGKPTEWRIELGAKATQFQLRIVNPMKGGVPLRFANEEQGDEWLQVTF